MEFASNAKGNAALTTGIIGTAGAALPLLSNLLGGRMGYSCEDQPVSRYELRLHNESAEKDSRIALLEANIYNDQKSLELYRYVDGKIDAINARLCQQDVVNAQVAANISCMQQSIATLQGLTKTIIPIGGICPSPMPEFNSWTAPVAGA